MLKLFVVTGLNEPIHEIQTRVLVTEARENIILSYYD
jgi:hypothetical protein